MRTNFAGYARCIHMHAKAVGEWQRSKNAAWLPLVKTWAFLARAYKAML
jgi:hypothetical protein